jgi:CheY-like chemotaxis protein
LEVRLPSVAVVLDADGARLAQVLVNLLDNASKYSSEGQCIRLGGDLDGDRLRFWISDDGIGIHAADLPHLFETFAPVGESSGSGGAGLGIGLALTRRLVEMHGGSIEASSAGPGCGTTLTFWLPLPADDRGAAAAAPSAVTAPADPRPAQRATRTDPAAAADVPAPRSGPRVLVVDDNADVAQSLSMLLDVNGFQVRTAANGLAGVDAAARERPDIVLLDIGMPGIDGYEVCRRIRRQPGGGAMRIIALTGWGQLEDRRRSAAAGFDGHLVKPIEPAALLGMLREAGMARAASPKPDDFALGEPGGPTDRHSTVFRTKR